MNENNKGENKNEIIIKKERKLTRERKGLSTRRGKSRRGEGQRSESEEAKHRERKGQRRRREFKCL